MVKENLVKRLAKEEFGRKKIDWQVSERRGERMPYAENSKAYFFRMEETGTIIVQPKSPPDAMPNCYECQREIITVVRPVYTTKDNDEKHGSPFYQEWIDHTMDVAIPYCTNCDPEPTGGERFSSIEAFHRKYGKKFEEVLPTKDTPRRR